MRGLIPISSLSPSTEGKEKDKKETPAENLFLSVLKGTIGSPPPIWMMRQAGRYLPEYRELRAGCGDFLDLCYTPEKAAAVTLQPLKRFSLDAAILFSDILVIPHALGADLRFAEGEGPLLSPITSARDIEALRLDGMEEGLAPILETVRRVRAELTEDKALIGFAGAPWTLACYMIEGKGSKEFAKARAYAYANKKDFSALMVLLVEATVRYLSWQIEAGAQALQLFDSWAGLAAADQFQEWVIRPTKEIISRMKKTYPHIPIIGFAKGVGVKLETYAKETGCDAVGIDTHTPIEWAVAHLGGGVVLQGNLDPVLLASDKEGAVEAAKRIVELAASVPFIFNLGHGILPHTPIAHVEALMKAVKGS